MNMIWVPALLILAYLIGSFSTAVWFGRWFYGVDIRDKGSGNAGATNTVRVLGWRLGLMVLLVDVIKGILAVWLMRFFFPDESWSVYAWIGAAAAVVLGHTFPLFTGFKGGKGVATLLGVGIALFPISIWLSVGVFVIVLASTRYVSLGSVMAAVFFPFFVWMIDPEMHMALRLLSFIAAAFLLITHRKNLMRLIKGEETKIKFG